VGFGRRLARKAVRRSVPRPVRRAMHPVRTAKRAVTPRPVRQVSRAVYTITTPSARRRTNSSTRRSDPEATTDGVATPPTAKARDAPRHPKQRGARQPLQGQVAVSPRPQRSTWSSPNLWRYRRNDSPRPSDRSSLPRCLSIQRRSNSRSGPGSRAEPTSGNALAARNSSYRLPTTPSVTLPN
jgi:hypothetical protein